MKIDKVLFALVLSIISISTAHSFDFDTMVGERFHHQRIITPVVIKPSVPLTAHEQLLKDRDMWQKTGWAVSGTVLANAAIRGYTNFGKKLPNNLFCVTALVGTGMIVTQQRVNTYKKELALHSSKPTEL